MPLQKLQNQAYTIDKEGIYPSDILKELAKQGKFSVLKTRNDLMQAIENIAEVSKICGTSGFCMWCQFALIYYLINSKNQKLKDELLPKLYSGEILGGTGLSNPMKAFANIEQNRLKATKTDGGYIVNGTLAWVSNLSQDSVFGAIAIDESGEPVMGVIRIGQNATLRSQIKYSTLEGSATKSVVLKEYFLSYDDILSDNIYRYLVDITPGFIALQIGIGAGIIEASLDEIQSANRANEDINSYLPFKFDELKAEYEELIDKSKSLLDDIDNIVPLELLQTRLAASLLTQKVTSAAVLSSGASGYLERSKVARLQREGNFVLIVTPSIKHLLKEIANIKSGGGCICSWKKKLKN